MIIEFIYKGEVNASKITSDWYSWIHNISNNIPTEQGQKKFSWQKEHEENLTGTDKAYKPEGSLSSDSKKKVVKYEIWKS